MASKSQWNFVDDVFTGEISEGTAMNSKSSFSKKKLEYLKAKIAAREQEGDLMRKKEMSESNRNVVIFTGRALVEILRDQTMQKSFMTLAYISDMMVGSEISPIQK